MQLEYRGKDMANLTEIYTYLFIWCALMILLQVCIRSCVADNCNLKELHTLAHKIIWGSL